jgi:hypothetical protein
MKANNKFKNFSKKGGKKNSQISKISKKKKSKNSKNLSNHNFLARAHSDIK